MKRAIVLTGLLIGFAAAIRAADPEPYSQSGLYLVGNGQIRPIQELLVTKEKPKLLPSIPFRKTATIIELEPIIEKPVCLAPETQYPTLPAPDPFLGRSPKEKIPEIAMGKGPVSVIFPQRINSGNVKPGDVLKLKMGTRLLDQSEKTIISKDAEVFATIKTARRGGFFSRRGEINICLDYVRGEGGRTIPISGTITRFGGGNKNLTLSGALLVAWPLFFLQGSDAVIEAGTIIPANVGAQNTIKSPGCRLEAE